MEYIWRFLKKLKIEQPCDPAVLLLGKHLEKTIIQKNRCTPKFTAAILNREDTLATKMSIDRGKDTEVVYIYNGILLSH